MAEGSRILIVDDEPGIRQVINTNLVMQGYETLEAKNGRQCLDILAEEAAVDLVILDVMMPGTNGWEVLESMRDQPEMAGISVMLLTAVSTEESKVKGFELGAADYLVKPFAIGELLARVQRILSEKQEREALAEFSITDWVTGLFNRRYLELRLGQEVARSLRYKSPLSGIFFDIDQLPAINEHDGPRLIDALLGQLASLLRGQIRACDLVFRYDGDFFFLLLPDTDGVGAFEVAERIRRTIDTEEWAEDKHLTAAIGVVELSQGETPEGFVSRAEDALHHAKGLGGDATWSAFAQAGGRVAEPELAVEPEWVMTVTPAVAIEPEPILTAEPQFEYALPEVSVSVSDQPLPQVSLPTVFDDAPPEYFEPAATEAAVAEPVEAQPAAEPASPVSIPLPTAQTQVMKTGDLAALRESLVAATPPEAGSYAPQEAPVVESAPLATQPPAPTPEPEPSATPEPAAAPTPEPAAAPASPVFDPQPQVQGLEPEQPTYQQETPAYPSAGAASGWGTQQPPPVQQPVASVQPEPEQGTAPPQAAAPGPSSWADAQMMAAAQFTAPPAAEPEPRPVDAPPEPLQPGDPTYLPGQQPQQ